MNNYNQLSNNILFSCESKQTFASEQIVMDHALGFVISGKLELRFLNEKIEVKEGDISFIRRNQLVKALKLPDEKGLPFKSINIFLTQENLRNYAMRNHVEKQDRYFGHSFVDLSDDNFIKAYFKSLVPYFKEPEKFTPQMALVKTTEAIELLLAGITDLKQCLFDLSEPHKIDLEKFVKENFLFNIPISEFARLSGRSLSTFKRDFKTIFQEPPEKWLRNRRLEEARYLIAEKKLKPSEVHYNVGFENFSHFSDAFKKRFGFNASKVIG